MAVLGLSGLADPCVAFDHPNVSSAHAIKVFGLRVSPAEGSVPLPGAEGRFWGWGARAGLMAEGLRSSAGSRARRVPLPPTQFCLWRRHSISTRKQLPH